MNRDDTTSQKYTEFSRANIPEDAEFVFAMCDTSGRSPIYVSREDKIAVHWGWMADTRQQIQDHIEQVVFDMTINGQPVTMDIVSEIKESYDDNGVLEGYSVFFYHYAGKLAPGSHLVEIRITWKEEIYDGWDYYGPGTSYPDLGGFCEIIVE